MKSLTDVFLVCEWIEGRWRVEEVRGGEVRGGGKRGGEVREEEVRVKERSGQIHNQAPFSICARDSCCLTELLPTNL